MMVVEGKHLVHIETEQGSNIELYYLDLCLPITYVDVLAMAAVTESRSFYFTWGQWRKPL